MRKLIQIHLSSFVLILLAAFNFSDNPPSNWYRQFLPELNSANIKDIMFTDSLTGYSIANLGFGNNNYILKTTNRGDNWDIIKNYNQPYQRIIFINQNTGFANTLYTLLKTTNQGVSWDSIKPPADVWGEDMFVLNKDTIYFANHEGLTGGVFRTTNGGVNWTQQLNLGGSNPTNIYFYNANTGFISINTGSSYVMRTTNSGMNWTTVVSNEGFTDMHFVDSLTGWRAYGLMKKTTNGGLNWVTQPLPSQTGLSQITKFSVLNKDTIWGVNGYYVYPNNEGRGVLYTTTNGGANWYFQVPDTNIKVFRYNYVQFIDKNHGWAYNFQTGIHTNLGGDPITAINSISLQTPSDYRLYQNYPNPFNPTTTINYELRITNYVSLKVYSLNGKEIVTLINNRKQNSGTYTISFDANKYNLSSGIYFYTLQTQNFQETKKMMLIK